jgi:hypothetical protein
VWQQPIAAAGRSRRRCRSGPRPPIVPPPLPGVLTWKLRKECPTH